MEISSTTETLDQFTAGLEEGFINITLATLGCKEIYKPPCSWVDNITCSLNPPTENRTENPGLNISNEDGCFHQSLLEDTTEFRHYKQFSKTVGLITIVVSSCGILGNLLSILVLVLKETRNCFNQLLIALNIFDSLFLVFAILEGLRTDFNQIYLAITSQYFLNFVHYPLLRICMCASIFLIIGVAVERYLAVCRPHHYRELQVQNYRAFIYIVPSALAAIGLNFPRFLEITTADYCIVMEECGCETIVQTHHVPSDMRNHPLYVLFYSNLAWLFFTGIIPFIVLTILNLKIYRSMQIVKRNLQKSSTVGGAAMRMTD
ncbi:FMRFamide receptor [Eurytemora carolleeae]|uniref:FMRFamide receptor n=1 Tax=Eurytemora carolleeae TaxID=1294199 RepID=UPI000C76584C|nr:FMRFamide receptor [Eurytemora carolleeae]|eukprot:XP_023337012.1 FMRFamide receptor-like [Eurytemora affinis]